MQERPELYFPRDIEWREWLDANHHTHPQGVLLIFYKLELNVPTMRWEEAVRVALCYGWIDSTVQSLGNGKRQQYFCPRNPKSYWSALNKSYIEELEAADLIHESGWKTIRQAKESGTWSAMDDVENGVIPPELQKAFDTSPMALDNFNQFAPGYRKSYLSWLFQAKRPETRAKRIKEIVRLCLEGIKSRQ
ncbi:YdeI/OmpD-associated family protein [Altibacter sp.]|uniref:YdeI/OmpD-associated family protein n=1 Tax=Altibacter sp. TaxID=2024823 RepID=UPI000C907B8B|nr:YdeI/OmpD-associated family protein [Altibacter sp.]MAP54991.1 hypothetical protein [Altibacter sp.]